MLSLYQTCVISPFRPPWETWKIRALLEDVLMKREALQISPAWASRAVQSSHLPEVMGTSASRTRGWGLPRGAFLGIRPVSAPCGENLDSPRAVLRLNSCCARRKLRVRGSGSALQTLPLVCRMPLGPAVSVRLPFFFSQNLKSNFIYFSL